MIGTSSSADIPFFSNSGGKLPLTLKVYSPRNNDQAILLITDSEAAEHGEEPVQLLEGLRYEYELSDSCYRIREENGSGIIFQSTNPKLAHCGTLSTGLNTGKLVLVATDPTDTISGVAVLEIRPRKLGHRDHYRLMLEEITDTCVALAMELRAPTNMRAAPSPGTKSETIHQRFSFLKALINSVDFQNALHRITTHPHKRWESEQRHVDIRRNFRPNARTIQSIAKAARRIPVPATHKLSSIIESLPERITVYGRSQSDDTNENQFVKFVLQNYIAFLRSMYKRLDEIDEEKLKRGLKKSEVDNRLKSHISTLEAKLLNALDADVFRSLSDLTMLPVSSPVLQRKEGYREIFQSWLKFDLAARLIWSGGDDVYGAGQKDIATLYEYWVFFKLLSIVSNIFKLEKPAVKSLIEETKDGFGIKLKSGQQLAFDGVYDAGGRRLRVQFGYNRSFIPSTNHDLSGSWTQLMRPDYTLSFWPAAQDPHSLEDMDLNEAERQNLVSHIHFDAKYRIDNIQEIFGFEGELLSEQGNTSQQTTYKRDDLLKMHAYRDAIRRTHGAYVLYPGNAHSSWKEFHELLPGLGAFPMRPGSSNETIENFIRDVVQHVCDRASQRERASFHIYRIHKSAKSNKLTIPLPELDDTLKERAIPPAELTVLLGPTNSGRYFDWISENKIYPLRAIQTEEGIKTIAGLSTIHYVLVCSPELLPRTIFMKIKSNGIHLVSGSILRDKGCPDVSANESYFIYEVEEFSALQHVKWDVPSFHNPKIISLEELLSTYVLQY